MKVVGVQGYKPLGVELPDGTLVKWESLRRWSQDGEKHMLYSIRHTDRPLPRQFWTVEFDESRSYVTAIDAADDSVDIYRFVTQHLGAP